MRRFSASSRLRILNAVFASLAALVAAAAGGNFQLPFGKWVRLSLEPIVSPRGNGFESAGTFNPSVVIDDGKFVMLYRAQDAKGRSSLGYATSEDGVHFTRRDQPVFVGEAAYHEAGGAEYRRIAAPGAALSLTPPGYNKVDP